MSRFSRTSSSSPAPRRLIAAATALVIAATGAAVALPAVAAPTVPALFVSEILPDNTTHTFTDAGGTKRTTTQDNFEFFEVTNTTGAAIDLAASGYALAYANGATRTALTVESDSPAPAVVPAHGSAIFWLRYQAGSADGYSSGSPNAKLFDDEQFRAHYGIDGTAPLVYVGGQAGLANSGTRGIAITRSGDAVSTSLYTRASAISASATPEPSIHFAAPAAGATDATSLREGAATPGTVTADQLPVVVPDPEPSSPSASPSASPSTSPSPSGPPTDPALKAPLLQVTEVAPDTANLNGGDAWEFIEIYNASDAPIDFGDYTLNYLYTDNALTGPVTTNSTLWPATPRSVVIAPASTIVVWIRNAANAGLTAADFNAQFGTSLVAGTNLLETASGGFANAGSRGIQVRTNSGLDVSRAYYFTDDQTTATTAIQYAWNPAGDALWRPTPADQATQTLVRLAKPTPGSVDASQVPAALVAAPKPGTAPKITDLTGGTETPDTDDLNLAFDITDDAQVRTVTLEIVDNLGGRTSHNLTFDSPGRYAYAVPAADLYGKKWVEYTVTASDGSQKSRLGPVRVQTGPAVTDPVRLNVTDGQFVSGTVPLRATTDGDVSKLGIAIDDRPVAPVTPSLEAGPLFAFEATSTDAFFRNGVKLGDDVLTIFDEGFYARIVTVDAAVPVDKVERGKPLTLSVTAGTKAWPNADPNENNDDFSALNFRLALPDGRVLRPVSCATTKEAGGAETAPAPYTCPTGETRVAFSDATLVSFRATFDIPTDAFDSLAAAWNTKAVADGPHTIVAAGASASTKRTVTVDNTAPAIQTPLVADTLYRGDFEIAATAKDAGSGLGSLTATLDGAPITLPLRTSSLAQKPGAHTVVFTATDAVGNSATREIAFRTADETPGIVLNAPDADGTVTGGTARLTATATSPERDALDVAFREGYSYTPTDAEVTAAAGTTTVASSTDRSAARALSADELTRLGGSDGIDVETTSDDAFPYQLFTVKVPAGAGADASARVSWQGRANADAKVRLYVKTTAGSWEQVDQYLTTDKAPTSFTLGATVPVAGHAAGDVLTFLVQHSEGFAGTQRSERAAVSTPYSPGATPRQNYDFTFAWESDTQYYNDNEGYRGGSGGTDAYYKHQIAIHDFLLKNRDQLNLQYLLHTGDIVDDYIATSRAPGNDDPAYQWRNADAQYKRLDDAGLPYGVLAGNHDVGHAADDYSQFGTYFGTDRYAANPWYGGSYKNNRGHYDLVSVGGVDFLMLYLGWPAVNNQASNDEDITWLNQVIAQYPERKVWLNLHEYMLTTGGLGPIPQRIYDEVVATNPNVFSVSSGHYHDAFTRTDDFDDDGDGTADRTVYSMLFDYQGLQEGGLGYLRLLHFDNTAGTITVRTYSPSLDRFDSDDAGLNDPAGMQEFTIPYGKVGLASAKKTLATDAFRADILTTHEIGRVSAAPSGAESSATWSGLADGRHGWFATATGPHGGTVTSELRAFTTVGAGAGEPGTGEPGTGNPGTGEPGTGTPGTGTPGTGTPGTGLPGTGTSTATITLGASTVPQGGTLKVSATGLAPSTAYRIVLHSDPITLATVSSTAAGSLATTVTIPAGAPVGAHTVQLVSAADPATVLASAPLTLTAGALSATGDEPRGDVLALAVLVLVAGGLLIARRARRRGEV